MFTLVISVHFHPIFHPLPHKPKGVLLPFEITLFIGQYLLIHPKIFDGDMLFYWVKSVLTTFSAESGEIRGDRKGSIKSSNSQQPNYSPANLAGYNSW
jgi:hypothetical protein